MKPFYVTLTTTTSQVYRVEAADEDDAEARWAQGKLIETFCGDPEITEVTEQYWRERA